MNKNELREKAGFSKVSYVTPYTKSLNIENKEDYSEQDLLDILRARELVQKDNLSVEEAVRRVKEEKSSSLGNEVITPLQIPPSISSKKNNADPKQQMADFIQQMAEQSARKLASKYPEMLLNEIQIYMESEEYAELWENTAREMLISKERELDEYLEIIDVEIKNPNHLSNNQHSGSLPSAQIDED